jgi:hypothetical protein
MISPLDRVFQPWELKPFELICWRDMLQFSANGFFWVGRALRSLREDCFIGCARCIDGEVGFATALDLDERARGKALGHLPRIEEQFQHLGLSIAAETAKELQTDVADRTTRRSFEWLHGQVEGIEKIAEKELKGKFFLYIPAERIKYWPKPKSAGTGSLFGQEVSDKFPSAGYDIMCSGITFGTAMTTASVFHLMRVMETGLAALGKVFGISAAFANWEVVLNQIESKIAGMRSDPAWKTVPDCKEQQEYYSQAASYFRTVKDAWRNYTMHSRAKYTEEEAEQIFNAVKGFMQKLAERLSE